MARLCDALKWSLGPRPGSLGVVALLSAMLVWGAGCGPRTWVVVGSAERAYPQVTSSEGDPFAEAAAALLRRFVETGIAEELGDDREPRGGGGPVAVAIHRVELQDPSPPADFPSDEGIWSRLIEGVESAESLRLVRATALGDSPVLLSDTPVQWTLNFEAFRLADLRQAPDRAFYLPRLWVFDAAERATVWEATGDPIAWRVRRESAGSDDVAAD